MHKQTIDGHEVEFELADENFPKNSIIPFYVKNIDGKEYDKYHVVLGKTEKDEDIPKSPIDGHICAICLTREDSLMVAASIRIAKSVAEMSGNGDMKKAAQTVRERAKSVGWDVDKAEAKIDELIKQGKSNSEILAYMNEHKWDFKKPDAPKDDAPKSAEEW